MSIRQLGRVVITKAVIEHRVPDNTNGNRMYKCINQPVRRNRLRFSPTFLVFPHYGPCGGSGVNYSHFASTQTVNNDALTDCH